MKRDIHTYVGGPFRAHGDIEMWREGAIVRLKARGPFNREAVLGLGRAMGDLLAADPPPAVFGDLLELRGSMMTSPDSLQALGEFMQAMGRDRTPPRAVAYVAGPDVEGRDFMLPLFEALYRQHGRDFAAFDTLPEAQTWLLARLAHDAAGNGT